MRHRIKHHVNRPVLHMGLFSDTQMLPAACLFTLAAGWLYAGSGGMAARVVAAAVMLVPVAVMAIDNRVGGIVVERARALARWRRQSGIFAPRDEPAATYEVAVDEQDRLVLERERLARVDLEAVFAQDSGG